MSIKLSKEIEGLELPEDELKILEKVWLKEYEETYLNL